MRYGSAVTLVRLRHRLVVLSKFQRAVLTDPLPGQPVQQFAPVQGQAGPSSRLFHLHTGPGYA